LTNANSGIFLPLGYESLKNACDYQLKSFFFKYNAQLVHMLLFTEFFPRDILVNF